jgi:hypothetical protein
LAVLGLLASCSAAVFAVRRAAAHDKAAFLEPRRHACCSEGALTMRELVEQQTIGIRTVHART